MAEFGFMHRVGRSFLTRRRRVFRGNVDSMQQQNAQSGLIIDFATGLPLTPGEYMDYGMAVEGLLSMEVGGRVYSDEVGHGANAMIAAMDNPKTAAEVDETLIDWMLELTPAQRLDELENRVEFFELARKREQQPIPDSSTDS